MEYCDFQFTIVAKDELNLPYYKGSAFRGLFGHALKQTVCVTNMSDCANCLLKNNCAYAYIFETFNNRGERVARPFVLEPPMNDRKIFPPGDSLKVNLILFGKAMDYIPYIIYAFKEMGRKGIGRSKGRFWLKRVTAGDKVIYDYEEQILHNNFVKSDLNFFNTNHPKVERLKIHFVTPTAVKVMGKIQDEIDFNILLKAIRRRLKALDFYHNGKFTKNLQLNLEDAKGIHEKSKFEPFHWRRYSNRQQQKIDFSGFIGEMELEGDLTPFMPLLRMGEVVHIGRGTVYGMGKYVIDNNFF